MTAPSIYLAVVLALALLSFWLQRLRADVSRCSCRCADRGVHARPVA